MVVREGIFDEDWLTWQELKLNQKLILKLTALGPTR